LKSKGPYNEIVPTEVIAGRVIVVPHVWKNMCGYCRRQRLPMNAALKCAAVIVLRMDKVRRQTSSIKITLF
jgi:hypothetical protein